MRVSTKKNAAPKKKPLFTTSTSRVITLTFPDALYAAYYGKTDFHKTLTANEARLLAASLVQSADELDAAQ